MIFGALDPPPLSLSLFFTYTSKHACGVTLFVCVEWLHFIQFVSVSFSSVQLPCTIGHPLASLCLLSAFHTPHSVFTYFFVCWLFTSTRSAVRSIYMNLHVFVVPSLFWVCKHNDNCPADCDDSFYFASSQFLAKAICAKHFSYKTFP